MNTKTVLTDKEIIVLGIQACAIEARENGYIQPFTFARAIEQAVLQSPEVQALKHDKGRLDWLADPNNNIGNVQLPKVCILHNLHSLRAAIDDAMEQKK